MRDSWTDHLNTAGPLRSDQLIANMKGSKRAIAFGSDGECSAPAAKCVVDELRKYFNCKWSLCETLQCVFNGKLAVIKVK